LSGEGRGEVSGARLTHALAVAYEVSLAFACGPWGWEARGDGKKEPCNSIRLAGEVSGARLTHALAVAYEVSLDQACDRPLEMGREGRWGCKAGGLLGEMSQNQALGNSPVLGSGHAYL
jgi:hypothetical protein